jgi:hypothetical protein
MKSIFLALIFLLRVDYIIASEKYTVIKVVGVILMKNTSNPLVAGNQILSSDPIVFKTPDAKASVISSEKGRMVLTAEGVVDKQGLVKSSLIPPMSNIASRNGPILSISDVQSYFSGEYLLLSQAKVMISKSIFPMNDSSFFFIRYLSDGIEINKKLSSKNELLLIDRNELLKVDGRSVSFDEHTKVKVGYFSGTQSLIINEMVLITPDINTFSNEIDIIIKQNTKKDANLILDDIVAFANEFYGKADREQLKGWLIDNFSLQF